ncbi:MAG: hypothetical protein HY744_13800 [Deltaproteobacteria bacterium]|nr:hypothetical protein [Deltaproteobacteria bacterium]
MGQGAVRLAVLLALSVSGCGAVVDDEESGWELGAGDGAGGAGKAGCAPCAGASCGLCGLFPAERIYRCTGDAPPEPSGCRQTGSVYADPSGRTYVCWYCGALAGQ